MITHNNKSDPDHRFVHSFDLGESWVEHSAPSTEWNTANDIFVLSETEAWATVNDKIARWNGTSWAAEHTGSGATLTRIFAHSASDVWVIGGSSELWHYNGVSWSNEYSNMPTAISLEDIHGPAGTAYVYVVGQLAGNTAYVEEYNGSSWSELLGGASVRGRSIWAGSTTHHQLGRHDAGSSNPTTTQVWNGVSYTAPDLNLSNIEHVSGTLHGLSSTDLLINVFVTTTGETWQRDGSSWSEITTGSDAAIVLGKISSYFFSEEAPKLANISPEIGASNVPQDTQISFSITDDASTVKASILVYFDDVLVYNGSSDTFSSGWTVGSSIVANGSNGYDIVLQSADNFAPGTHRITVYAEDDGARALDTSWQWYAAGKEDTAGDGWVIAWDGT